MASPYLCCYYLLGRRPRIHSMLDYYEYVRKTLDDEPTVISVAQIRGITFGYQPGSPVYLLSPAGLYPDTSLGF